MKLQIFIQKSGYASRRKSVEIVLEGIVKVNGEVEKNFLRQIDPENDIVEILGKKVVPVQEFSYYLFNKPSGYICTKIDTHNQPTIWDFLKEKNLPENLNTVGRLDKDTEGLLILTNDGNFANLIAHPGLNIEKEYFALVRGTLSEEKINLLESGIELEEFTTSKAKVKVIKENLEKDFSSVIISITEGHKRQVKRMFLEAGNRVFFLKRVMIGRFTMSGIENPGDIREITQKEVEDFKKNSQKKEGVQR